MNFKLSPSSLSLMKECPRCFWLTQHKVWKRPSGIFPSLPSGMDAILKTHFNKFIENGELPPELKHNGDCKNMKLFDDHELLAIWRSNFKGIQWEDGQGNILKGAVDNILMKDIEIFYNFVKPHEALKGKTPSELAILSLQFETPNRWLELIKMANSKN